MKFGRLIDREASVLRKLHEDIHYIFDHEAKVSRHGMSWREACARFHAHASPLDHWIEAALSDEFLHDSKARDFVLTFLERDPVYFRSGYVKEVLLRRLKRVNLVKKDRDRLDKILLDAVRRRGGREFRRYCQLAVNVGSADLRAEIVALTGATDKAVASRATMMLRYLRDTEDRQT